MTLAAALIPEVEQEAKTTRRVLERVPQDKLAWKPHPKSMSLGQLALHIAEAPGQLCAVLEAPEFDFPDAPGVAQPNAAAEILKTFEAGVVAATRFLRGLDDAKANAPWKLKKKGKVLLELPRIAFIRSILMNHLYHHRGQLSVYLRLLNVPVPSIYGPSADENPFG